MRNVRISPWGLDGWSRSRRTQLFLPAEREDRKTEVCHNQKVEILEESGALALPAEVVDRDQLTVPALMVEDYTSFNRKH